MVERRKVDDLAKGGDGMRLFYTNRIDAEGVVITATSEVDTLPAENVADEFRKRVWRTGTSSALEAVVFDLGSAKAVTAVILLDHTLTSGDSLIKVQGHTSDSWGAPAFSQTLTHAADIIAAVFASQTYRYWRVTFTKSSAGESRDIGRIFLGTYDETDEAPDYDGLQTSPDDLSRRQTTIGGQEYVELIEQREVVKCDFTHISNTMKAALQTYIAAVGNAVSHFIQVATSSPFDTVFYVRMSNAPRFKVEAMDASPVWGTSLEYKEQV